MANTDKNIVITPNTGSGADPTIVFSGANGTIGPENITLTVTPNNGGTVAFSGSAGQLLAITNDTSNTLSTDGTISATGNITANNFVGNLVGNVTGNFSGSLANGNSNVSIPSANGNVNISAVGVENVVVVTGTGANVAGTLSVSGDANIGNIGATNGVFTNVSGNGSSLSSLTGANVTGQVSNALVSGTVYTNAQPNITSVGTLTTLSVSGNANVSNIGATNGVFTNVSGNGSSLSSITGANVTGQVSNALVSGTVYTNAQPNITSVGTLDTLSVTGNANVGNIGATNGVFTNISGNASTITGLTLANSLSDVSITAANSGQFLGYNGVNWVNSSILAPVSAGQGVGFWLTTPVIINNNSANNFNQLDTLNSQPNTSAQSYANATINGTGLISGARSSALGRTVLDAGNWDFSIWANVNATGGTSTLSATMHSTIPFPASGTVTITGTGTSRTVTASADSPFANATTGAGNIILASFVETPRGLYPITAIANSTSVTITTPSTYVNEVAVNGYTWNPLFNVGSTTLAGTAMTEYLFGTTQSQFTVTAATGVGLIMYGITTQNKTIFTTINGSTQATHIASPLITLHDSLAGLQGGQSDEYYHLTTSEYTGSGTGVFVRDTSPSLVTPNIGAATATSLSVSGNANVGNLGTAGLITATGNITGNYILGNGALLTGIITGTASTIANGNSNVNIPAANGNVNISAVGNANVVVVTGTGANVNGTLSVSGNANVGNIGATNGVFTNISGNGSSLSSITGANVTGQVANALVSGTVYTNAQPNITSVGTLTSLSVSGTATAGNLTTAGNLSVSGNVNFGSASNVSLGNVSNLKIIGGSNLQFLQSLGSSANSTQWTSFSLYTRTYYVDPTNGLDTNNGSYQFPFKTITGAQTAIGGTSGLVLYLTNGTYSENVTWTNTNCEIIGIGGGLTNLTGTWTINPATSSVRFQKCSFTNTITLSSTGGSVYFRDCMATGTINKSGNGGYLEAINTDFGAATAINVTGSGSVFFLNSRTINLTINNSSALVTTQNSPQLTDTVVTAGTLLVEGSFAFSSTTTGNAISAAIGAFAVLKSTSCYQSDQTNGRVSLLGFTSLQDTSIDNANSSLGTNLTLTATSDALQTVGNLQVGAYSKLGGNGNVIITGGSSGQYLQTNGSGNLSWATISTASISNGNSNVNIPAANGNVNISAAGQANRLVVTGTGANIAGTLSVSGNANVGNIGAANGVFTNVSGNGSSLSSITGGNVTGQVGNALISGTVYTNAQPNITSVGTLSSLSVSGNITGANLIGTLANGNSNVNIPTANGNVNISAVGNANIVVVTGTGANIAGTLSVSGNANVGNLGTGGLITATGNITGGNLITSGLISATGALTASSYTASNSLAGYFLANTGTNVGKIFENGNIIKLEAMPATYGVALAANGTVQLSFDANGYGAVGSSSGTTGYALRIAKQTTGAVTAGSILINPTVQTDVTSTATGVRTSLSTAAGAAPYTITNLVGYATYGGTIGANTTVTNQISYYVDSGSIGGTNNWGFYGGLASAASTFNLYMQGTANNYIAGSLGIGSTNLSAINLRLSKSITGGTTAYNFLSDGTISSDVTSLAVLNRASGITSNATFTLANLIYHQAVQGTFGTLSTVTTQSGFTADSTLTGATNNYGFRGSIAAGANRFNLYMDGTANNYIAGNFGIGNTAPTTNLAVTGTAYISGNANIGNLGTAQVLASANITAPQLISNVATGTAPLIVTSTTQVANLNVATAGTATSATTAGTVTTNAQPNITSVGTLTSLSVSGNITGGNLIGPLANGNSNVNIPTANGNVNITAVGNTTLVVTGTGANITGTLSVSGNANVDNIGAARGIFTTTVNTPLIQSGTSNITLASGGNISTIIGGNATAQLVVTATGANIPGTANVVGNANVGNLGTAQVLASANITAPQLISNVITGTAPLVVTSTTVVPNLYVARANVSDFSSVTTATTGNYYLNFVNALTGNLQEYANATFVANAANGAITATTFVGALSGAATSATTAGTVTTNAQPNITSVGTLTALSVSGNITGANLIGTLANGNSNVNIPAANGNVNISAVGTANVLVITATGANIAGTLSASGNANVANLIVGAGTGGNITGANVIAANTFLANGANGTIVANNHTASGNATGNANVSTITGNLGFRAIFSTYTDSSAAASATIANAAIHAIAAPNLAAANATVTFTNAATFYIAGAPVANTNATITNPYALFVAAGNSYFGGNVTFASNLIGRLANGNSNVNIPAANGNVNISAVGNANIFIVTGTGVNVTGSANIAGATIISGNTGLPAATGTSPVLAGNYGSPLIGKLYIGDGTGWNFRFASRTGSTDTDRITFFDNGNTVFTNAVSGITTLSVTGNANVGNIGTGIITSSGNVTGANIISTTNHIFSVATGISAAGTTQGTATAVTKDFNVVSTVLSGNGISLPTAVAGMRITVVNTSANALLVYPLGNGLINTQAANASYSQPAGARLDFICTAAATAPGGQWYTLNATYG